MTFDATSVLVLFNKRILKWIINYAALLSMPPFNWQRTTIHNYIVSKWTGQDNGRSLLVTQNIAHEHFLFVVDSSTHARCSFHLAFHRSWAQLQMKCSIVRKKWVVVKTVKLTSVIIIFIIIIPVNVTFPSSLIKCIMALAVL